MKIRLLSFFCSPSQFLLIQSHLRSLLFSAVLWARYCSFAPLRLSLSVSIFVFLSSLSHHFNPPPAPVFAWSCPISSFAVLPLPCPQATTKVRATYDYSSLNPLPLPFTQKQNIITRFSYLRNEMRLWNSAFFEWCSTWYLDIKYTTMFTLYPLQHQVNAHKKRKKILYATEGNITTHMWNRQAECI